MFIDMSNSAQNSILSPVCGTMEKNEEIKNIYRYRYKTTNNIQGSN